MALRTEKQIPVKVTGKQRRATFSEARISQRRRRHLQQRGDVRSHPGRTSEVLNRREAEKQHHQSEVSADTQTSPIGKEVTTSPHQQRLLQEKCVCPSDEEQGRRQVPADIRNYRVQASTPRTTQLSPINLQLCIYCK